MLKEEFVFLSDKKHNLRYDYSLVLYQNNKSKVKIICPLHGTFEQIPHNHLRGHGCPKCATILKSYLLKTPTEILVDQFIKVHGDKYFYDKTIHINNKTKIIVTCPTHGDFTILPYHHKTGVGCSKCSNNYPPSDAEFILKCQKIHGNKYDYSSTKYKNNHTAINIICKKHGHFSQKPSHHLGGSGCPKCNSSKGEEKIRKILLGRNEDFIEQKKFKDCKSIKPLPFDFYLPKYNLCVEFDGVQHTIPVRGYDMLKKTKKNDNKKNYYCRKNRIKLIRISYKNFDKIESILNKKIKTS